MRLQTLGTGTAQLGQTLAVRGVPVSGSGNRVQIDYAITMPRAVELGYAIRCPGDFREGVVGETWHKYRARRIEELRRERERGKRAIGALTQAAIGRIGGSATASAPNTEVEVSARVDGRAAGEVLADNVVAEPQLAATDLGGRTARNRVVFQPSGRGDCAMTLWSTQDGQDLTGVTGSFAVTEIVDIDAEQRARRAAAQQAAVNTRARIVASLTVTGAAPGRAARMRAAERTRPARTVASVATPTTRTTAARARARERQALADAQARRRAAVKRKVFRQRILEQKRREQEAMRIAIERSKRRRAGQLELAMHARTSVIRWLMACGGDPQYRRRENARAEKNRRRVAALAVEARNRLRVSLLVLGADPNYRRRQNEADMLEFELRSREAARVARDAREARTFAIAWLLDHGASLTPADGRREDDGWEAAAVESAAVTETETTETETTETDTETTTTETETTTTEPETTTTEPEPESVTHGYRIPNLGVTLGVDIQGRQTKRKPRTIRPRRNRRTPPKRRHRRTKPRPAY